MGHPFTFIAERNALLPLMNFIEEANKCSPNFLYGVAREGSPSCHFLFPRKTVLIRLQGQLHDELAPWVGCLIPTKHLRHIIGTGLALCVHHSANTPTIYLFGADAGSNPSNPFHYAKAMNCSHLRATSAFQTKELKHWSGWLDSNQRPPAPEAGALPG